MDTIRIDKKQCRLVAHRGLSGMEKENSCAAFVLAGSRSYYGIETDVHVTADGKYLISHDSNLSRVSGVDIEIEKSPFDVLQSVPLFDTDGVSHRSDLVPPALEDYVSICRKYDKVPVLELKGLIEEKHIAGIIDVVRSGGILEKTNFISFTWENLVNVRKLLPDATLQLLAGKYDDALMDLMKKYRLGADFYYPMATQELIDAVHAEGLTFNCWTVDRPELADELIAKGVDFITTNILE